MSLLMFGISRPVSSLIYLPASHVKNDAKLLAMFLWLILLTAADGSCKKNGKTTLMKLIKGMFINYAFGGLGMFRGGLFF